MAFTFLVTLRHFIGSRFAGAVIDRQKLWGLYQLLAYALSCSLVCANDSSTEQPSNLVKVGVVIFEADSSDSSHSVKWQNLFAKWQEQSDLRFQFASGTHSDVLHWMQNKVIDAAVLPAGALIQQHVKPSSDALSTAGFHPVATEDYEYVATFGYPPGTTDFAESDRRKPGFHWFSRSVCVVPKGSSIENQEQLLQAIKNKDVRFLLVHPYSASGSLLPRSVLRDLLGVKLAAEQVEYTFSHSESLELLAATDDKLVGFVHDDALATVPEVAGSVRRIRLAELTERRIPNEALLVRSGFRHLQSLRSLATESGGTNEFSFKQYEDWKSLYGQVSRWTEGLGTPEVGFETRRLSLDEIGWLLLHSVRSQQQPPRLAVVLSGGGAKCSYQVGVVNALEEKLATMRETLPNLTSEQRDSLDIQLVVGTSGGALNALPVAMGISKTEAGRKSFIDAWLLIDQRDILRPPLTQRILMGLWFGLLQIAVLIWLARHLLRNPARRGWILCGLLVVLGVLQLTIRELHLQPWEWLGTNHLWHHLFLVFTFAVRSSAWGLLVVGATGLILQFILSRKGQHLGHLPRALRWAMGALLLALPVCGLLHLFFYQKTLSTGDGVAQQLVGTFERLIETAPDLKDVNQRDKLHQLSLAAGEMLQRDLVVTGTCLAKQGQSSDERQGLPDDLYFYAKANSTSDPAPFGARGVPLRDPRYKHMLLDVVMGSGSIFPIFPPRELHDFPVEGESVELVDGGFAHNSPIEAAVEWGATHVIVIEATPETRSTRKNLVANLMAAMGHLQQQTQQVDRRSKQHVRVFTLEPRPPHLCILCFANNLIERAICRGYYDAKGTPHPNCDHAEHIDANGARFSRWFEEDLGPANFIDVEAAPTPIARLNCEWNKDSHGDIPPAPRSPRGQEDQLAALALISRTAV